MAHKVKIDEIDAKILKILLLESRTSFTDIAAVCKITVTAVRMRYKRLWKEGVINGEVMLINPHCLGYQHIVDLCITNAIEDDREVTKFLETKPYIAGLIGPWGNYNFLGKVALRDLKKLHDIIAKSDLPNLWKPKAGNYIKVESMPFLGTGKIDFVKLKETALAFKKSEDIT